MKAILTWLSLLVTAVTVGLLAAYLIPTLVSLIRANRNLVALAEGLEAVRDNTAPLAQDLPAINRAAATLEGRLDAVDGHLRGIIPVVRR